MRVIDWNCGRGFFWVRVFGRGVQVKDVRLHPLLFSERNGYRRVLRLGPLAVVWLPKWRRVVPGQP